MIPFSRLIGRALTLVITLAYPVSVFVALSWWDVQVLGLVLCLLGILRALLRGNGAPWMGRAAGWLLVIIGVIMMTTEVDIVARVYPILVNLMLLVWFGWSLLTPPPLIERLARLSEPDLPDHAITYTRRVTWVWLLFFLGNGLAAIYTTLFSTLEVWTLYNGLIAYVLMGCLFGIEYGIRLWVRRRHETEIG